MKRFSPEQTKWIGIGLAVSAILIGLYIVMSILPSGLRTPKGPHQTPSIAADKDARPREATSHIATEEMEKFIASIEQADLGQDPFLNSGEQEWKRFLGELRERPPRLKGIIQMKDARVALMHNSRFREGDEVKGFRIIKIEDKRVLLAKGGKVHTMHLAEE